MYHPTTHVLTVLELLQAHRQMSGPKLAERLEVDVRSVRRYIMMLQDLGIPIEAERQVPLSMATLAQVRGGVVLSCYVQELSWMAHFLVSLRCPLVVREPPELHEALRTLAAEIAQLAQRSEERYRDL